MPQQEKSECPFSPTGWALPTAAAGLNPADYPQFQELPGLATIPAAKCKAMLTAMRLSAIAPAIKKTPADYHISAGVL